MRHSIMRGGAEGVTKAVFPSQGSAEAAWTHFKEIQAQGAAMRLDQVYHCTKTATRDWCIIEVPDLEPQFNEWGEIGF